MFWVSLQDTAHSPLCTARAKRSIWWVHMAGLQILLNNSFPPREGKPALLLPSFAINQCHTSLDFSGAGELSELLSIPRGQEFSLLNSLSSTFFLLDLSSDTFCLFWN